MTLSMKGSPLFRGCILSWIKAVSMKWLNFACLYCTNKGLYIHANTVVEWTRHSSNTCPSATDAIFALGKGICFPNLSCRYLNMRSELLLLFFFLTVSLYKGARKSKVHHLAKFARKKKKANHHKVSQELHFQDKVTYPNFKDRLK